MNPPHVNVHHGPVEYDILTLQAKHRSQVVWNGDLRGEEACLYARQADKEF